MRQKKAKALRRKVYGDYSHRERKYVRDASGAIHCRGRRVIYQKMKRKEVKYKTLGRSET